MLLLSTDHCQNGTLRWWLLGMMIIVVKTTMAWTIPSSVRYPSLVTLNYNNNALSPPPSHRSIPTKYYQRASCCHIGSIVRGSSTTNRMALSFPDTAVQFLGDREEASRESPPSSIWELHPKSVRAVLSAMRDGQQLLEIEYPPLAANTLIQDDIGAYDVARANLNLAMNFAKSLRTTYTTLQQQQENNNDKNLQIAILVPDDAELRIALDNVKKNIFNNVLMNDNPQEPYPGVILSALRTSTPYNSANSEKQSDSGFQPGNLFFSLFGGAGGGEVHAVPGVNVYVIITVSAQELPDVETLHQLDPKATIICFNLKLDILRGDLGAPAFPPKAFQDRFLSRVKPVYYIRTRQYSRSTTRPPFLVSYQGCLFRSYPGDYQTLLDTGNGRYRRIKTSAIRPALGAFKEELTQALREQGVLEEESDTLNFLRTGYKTTTWWEEDRENASDGWKT